jgi:hypothetical protein
LSSRVQKHQILKSGSLNNVGGRLRGGGGSRKGRQSDFEMRISGPYRHFILTIVEGWISLLTVSLLLYFKCIIVHLHVVIDFLSFFISLLNSL